MRTTGAAPLDLILLWSIFLRYIFSIFTNILQVELDMKNSSQFLHDL